MRLIRAAFLPVRNDAEPLFICGAMGSGTTLITRLVDQHFHTNGVANETALQLPRSSPLHIRGSHRYKSLDEMTQSMFVPADADPITVRVDLLDYYRRIQRRKGPDAKEVVVVDKAPNAHLLRTSALRAAFPRSKFLFIYRNPISAVEGLRRKWAVCARAPFDHVARFWVLLHESFERDTAFFRDDVIPVPYETLTEDPERVLDVLEALVPLKRRKGLKEFTNKANREGFGIRNVSGGRIEVVRGVSQAARDRLEPRYLELVEEIAVPVFQRLSRNFPLPDLPDEDLKAPGSKGPR
ncbi:MAG: sulfotransferase family protein [Longimicrobiales bacterium]